MGDEDRPGTSTGYLRFRFTIIAIGGLLIFLVVAIFGGLP